MSVIINVEQSIKVCDSVCVDMLHYDNILANYFHLLIVCTIYEIWLIVSYCK